MVILPGRLFQNNFSSTLSAVSAHIPLQLCIITHKNRSICHAPSPVHLQYFDHEPTRKQIYKTFYALLLGWFINLLHKPLFHPWFTLKNSVWTIFTDVYILSMKNAHFWRIAVEVNITHSRTPLWISLQGLSWGLPLTKLFPISFELGSNFKTLQGTLEFLHNLR